MGDIAPKNTTPMRSYWLSFLKQGAQRLWRLPDQIGWLSPLPPLHRRGFIIITLLLLLALLWPYSESKENVVNSPPASTSNHTVARKHSEQDPNTRVKNVAQPQSWTRYQIKQGQTLAQLFRMNGLNVNDVFAMAQVEGREKPLSTLKIGQEVNIQRNQSGQVIALQITTPRNTTVRFQRNADGSFQRLR